jgi:hypothetical protein
LAIIYSITSDAGVIGYAAINCEPAAIAPNPMASLPILMQSRLPEIYGDFELESTDALPHLYMIGNDAIGLGAIAAGSQFMAAYPIAVNALTPP